MSPSIIEAGYFVEGDIKSVMQTTVLLTFQTAIFVKYAILTEYLTLFWFPNVVNEYMIEF